MNRNEAEYLARLAGQIAFGALLYGRARTRRVVRSVKARWLP